MYGNNYLIKIHYNKNLTPAFGHPSAWGEVWPSLFFPIISFGNCSITCNYNVNLSGL